MKTCPKCGRTLPLSQFYKRGDGSGNVQSWCMDCNKERGARKRYTNTYLPETDKSTKENKTMEQKQIKTIPLMESVQTTDKCVSFVYETMDYEKFVTFKENREPDHVGLIVKSILDYGAIDKPIICTLHPDYPGKLVAVDGNNSRFARMQLGLPIPYVIIQDATPTEMTALNLVSRNWTGRNYVDLYATLGYPDYLIFRNMLTEYPDFSFRSMQFLLQLSAKNDQRDDMSGTNHSVERGLFKCRDTKRTLDIINYLESVKKIENGRSRIYRADLFVIATIRLFNYAAFEPARALKKMEMFPFLICKQADTNGYLDMMEKIYNYHQKNDGIISFRHLQISK